MIALDVEQGSREWHEARRGLPTASAFDRLITRTGKPSTSAERYMHELLAAEFIGETVSTDGSAFMARGTEMEAQAREWYEFQHGVTVERVGLILRDDRSAGCSPDGLVGDDGLVEIKCPAAHVHVGYLLGGTDDYKQQMMGQLWITGRRWCDLVCYSPVLPCCVVRFERDEDFIAALAARVETFVRELADARSALLALGCRPPEAVVEAETF